MGAQAAFTQAIQLGPDQKPIASGLEVEFAPGRPLARALRQYRAVFTPEAGIAAAYNNRAAVRLLLRDYDGALQDTNQAVLHALNWGTPWTNAALAWLGKGNTSKALRCIKTAFEFGENTAQGYAVLAEAELEAGQLGRARDDLQRGADRDRTLPHLLAVQARLLHRQSRLRDSDRALLQGLTDAAPIVVDQLAPQTRQAASTKAGAYREGALRATRMGTWESQLYRLELGVIRQQVEGRPNAYQGRNEARFALGSAASGLVVGSVLNEFGGRPGSDTVFDPNATSYGLQRQSLALQKSVATPGEGRLTLQATARHSRAWVKPLAATTVGDRQLGGEALWRQGGWSVGGAWSQVRRATDYVNPSYLLVSPVEPLEQVTPNGITIQALGYGLYRKRLSRFVTLDAGPVWASSNGSQRVQAMADLAVRVTDAKTIHLRTTPHLVTAASDLFPAAIARPIQNNPIDQDRETINGFNRDPFLPGALGRFLSHELNLDQLVQKGLHLDTRLFHNQLFRYFAHSVDPRLGSVLAVTRAVNGPDRALVATPIAQAQMTGLEQRLHWEAAPDTTLTFGVTYQETRAAIPLAGPIPTTLRHLPYIPQWQANAAIDRRVAGWTATAEGFYLGRRPTALTQTEDQVPQTSAGVAKATAGVNLRLQGALSPALHLLLRADNLGRAQFYPGFSTRTAYTIGLVHPF